MTPTALDSRIVLTPSEQDAPDLARRAWEREGFRLLSVESVERVAPPAPVRWRVTARVELRR